MTRIISGFKRLANQLAGIKDSPTFIIDQELLYSREHFWFKYDHTAKTVSIGLAQPFSLIHGTPTYIEFEYDDYAEAESRVGIVETEDCNDIDIISPAFGDMVYVFDQDCMEPIPETLLTDPYADSSKLFVLELNNDVIQPDWLLNAEQYATYLGHYNGNSNFKTN